MQQDAGQTEPLGHAAREAGNQLVAFVAKVDEFENFVADSTAIRAFDAVGSGKEFEVLDDFHIVVDAKKVGHVADDAADFFRLGVDRIAANVGLAPGWVEQRRENTHRGGLARAIGANKTKHVALVELEFNLMDGVQVAVFFSEVVDFDHGRYEGFEGIFFSSRGRKPRLRQENCGFRSQQAGNLRLRTLDFEYETIIRPAAVLVAG